MSNRLAPALSALALLVSGCIAPPSAGSAGAAAPVPAGDPVLTDQTIGAELPVVATDPPTMAEGPAAVRADGAGDLPWSSEFEPPTTLTTARVHLEPLAPRHVELDFAALMSSREHLQRTLQWSDWPRDDFTLEENRADLERHWQEFEDREAYAYTVLSLDRERCVGCIYLVPPPDSNQRDAMLAYWVVEPGIAEDLDRHLLTNVLGWIAADWPFERVGVFTHPDNARGRALAEGLGLEPELETAMYVWQRAD